MLQREVRILMIRKALHHLREHQRGLLAGFALLAIIGLSLLAALPASSAAVLSITPITWNVIGLDSNDESVGPVSYTHLTLPTTPYV